MEINALFPIVEIQEKGFYIEPSYWIDFHLDRLFRQNYELFRDLLITIKIELDGFLIAILSNVLNFSFAIINEGKKAATAFGTYALGFFNINKECYKELQPIVSEIWAKIKVKQTFYFDGRQFDISYINCCDHKMQALVRILFRKSYILFKFWKIKF